MAEFSEINDITPRAEREHNRNERPAGAQTGAQRTKIPAALVGRGGVALVMYHLARLGIEFTQTAKDSDAADLWVKLPAGPIVTVEVKTASLGIAWPIRASQLAKSDLYVFVDLKGAWVWILRTQDLEKVIFATRQRAALGIYSVSQQQLPSESSNAWHIFSEGWKPVSIVKRPQKSSRRIAERVVRQKRADGTIKEYRYPPYVPR